MVFDIVLHVERRGRELVRLGPSEKGRELRLGIAGLAWGYWHVILPRDAKLLPSVWSIDRKKV